MNKVIGGVTVEQEQILHGDHHIITGVKIADETAAFKAGTVLYADGGSYAPLAKDDSTHTPCAVAVDALEEKADGAVVAACVHGAVRAEKLRYADGSDVTLSTAEALGTRGIYAIAGDGFTGYASAASESGD